MADDDSPPDADIIQQAFEQAHKMRIARGVARKLNIALAAIVSTPILLALILWRVW